MKQERRSIGKPLLSICIATYNRADYIGETLNSIIPQLDDDVELLVVDGASTDKTKDVVEEFVQKDSRIRYTRLPAKGGIDQDYDRSVELSRGEFCWLFTDDDLLKPGAVAAVKKAIGKGYDVVVVNAEVRDNTLSTVLIPRKITTHEDKIYGPRDVDNFFVDTVGYLSFVGGAAIRRSVWLARDRKSYFGTEFINVSVIFQKIMEAPVFVIAYPYIVIRWGNAQWLPRGFNIWMFKWPKLIWSFDNISVEAKTKIVAQEPWKELTIKNLIIYRRTGGYNIQFYRICFSTIGKGMVWKSVAWAIAIFPIKMMAPFYDFLLFLRNKRKKLISPTIF